MLRKINIDRVPGKSNAGIPKDKTINNTSNNQTPPKKKKKKKKKNPSHKLKSGLKELGYPSQYQ